MKPVKKFFVYTWKLSLASLYLADIFIDKPNTKFNFTEWFQIQKEFTAPFEEISQQELSKCLQKFYLSARKRNDRSLIALQNCKQQGMS